MELASERSESSGVLWSDHQTDMESICRSGQQSVPFLILRHRTTDPPESPALPAQYPPRGIPKVPVIPRCGIAWVLVPERSLRRFACSVLSPRCHPQRGVFQARLVGLLHPPPAAGSPSSRHRVVVVLSVSSAVPSGERDRLCPPLC
jgi:hypothetical protein